MIKYILAFGIGFACGYIFATKKTEILEQFKKLKNSQDVNNTTK